MTNHQEEIMKGWKVRSLILGAGLGALVGTLTAFLFIKQSEKNNARPKITPKHGINLGLGIVGLIRQFLDLGKGEK
jgi:hypothetical protein